MTRRAVLLVVSIFFLTLAGLVGRQGGVFALVLPILIYLGIAMWHHPGKLSLSGRRELERKKAADEAPVTATVQVENTSRWIEELELIDEIPTGLTLMDGKVKVLTSLKAGEKIELVHTIKGKRGDYLFSDIRACGLETFGLFQSQTTAKAGERLAILPSAIRMRPISIRPLQTRGFAGPIPSRQGGAGVDFLLVREYQSGDPLRQVNWKVSARSEREIYTTAYELQRIADVGIILDSRQQIDVRRGQDRLFEHAIRAASGLADLFLQDGNRVGLLVYGAAITSAFPGTGKLQRERILQVLAKAETGFSYALEKLDYLPTRFFPPRSQIILISPLVSSDVPVLGYLSQQGYSVLVVSPNAILFEADREVKTSVEYLSIRTALAERQLLINSLRRYGVLVVDWDVSAPLEPLVRTTAAAAVRRPRGVFQG